MSRRHVIGLKNLHPDSTLHGISARPVGFPTASTLPRRMPQSTG
jgi:hypothetical protein